MSPNLFSFFFGFNLILKRPHFKGEGTGSWFACPCFDIGLMSKENIYHKTLLNAINLELLKLSPFQIHLKLFINSTSMSNNSIKLNGTNMEMQQTLKWSGVVFCNRCAYYQILYSHIFFYLAGKKTNKWKYMSCFILWTYGTCFFHCCKRHLIPPHPLGISNKVNKFQLGDSLVGSQMLLAKIFKNTIFSNSCLRITIGNMLQRVKSLVTFQ